MTGPEGGRITRALISVSDKRGLAAFGQALAGQGVEILSTGGTAQCLRAAGVMVRDVSDYTGFPELMDGRLKTLHPRVHGGLLARLDHESDRLAMAEHGIGAIDLLVVNLYPFAETLAREGCTDAEAIEQIDIGGPAMLRAGAKNHERVTVVVDPGDYDPVLAEMASHGGRVSAQRRRALAARVFETVSAYDAMIAAYLVTDGAEESATTLPSRLALDLTQASALRYGENPHQRGALYVTSGESGVGIAGATRVQGKELSYNNLLDADAAWACVNSFEKTACVIVKHGNPCGVAEAESLELAYERAYATDPTSAFGGVIAFNRPLSAAVAEMIIARQFVEVLVAPAVDEVARPALSKKANVRVLVPGRENPPQPSLRRIAGGYLAQDEDRLDLTDWRVVTDRAPGEEETRDLRFAWRVAKFVKSNAIVYARDLATIGVGAGQMSRVDSARIAGRKAQDAGLVVSGSCLASDAFFPFRDGIDHAATAGVRAVIQPGGSVRDAEVIEAANQHGMAMVFTGLRHFRH